MNADLQSVGEPLAAAGPVRATALPAREGAFGVLLVDDNHHHRTPILRALRDAGYCVLHAAGGLSAEDLCRTSALPIDALVACAEMKPMGGVELARRVSRVRPDVRVLLMSCLGATRDVVHPAGERSHARIEDPFTPEDLRRRLSALLLSPPDEIPEEPRSQREARVASA